MYMCSRANSNDAESISMISREICNQCDYIDPKSFFRKASYADVLWWCEYPVPGQHIGPKLLFGSLSVAKTINWCPHLLDHLMATQDEE